MLITLDISFKSLFSLGNNTQGPKSTLQSLV